MLLSDACSFIFLTITITATCMGAESTNQELVERKPGLRTKREAIIIAGYPPNTFKLNSSNQRVSKLRYWHKKPKRGSLKPIYGPPPSAPNRITVKKYKKKQLRSKYNKYSSKRNAKPKYPSMKPFYGRHPKHPPKLSRPQPYYPQEPAGFGEPPKDLAQEYAQPPKQSYGEPPVDSYGNPLTQSFPTGLSPFENPGPSMTIFDQQQYQSLQSYHQDTNLDQHNSYSKHHPVYARPEIEEYDHEEPQKYREIKFDSYADINKQNPIEDYQSLKQKSKQQESHSIKKYNKAWKGKLKANEYDGHDHVMVGGKYAEPPGRLVPNYHHESSSYHGEEVAQDSYIDSALASSTSISPYINYKHSNMAFSPQNLNDAFSPFTN